MNVKNKLAKIARECTEKHKIFVSFIIDINGEVTIGSNVPIQGTVKEILLDVINLSGNEFSNTEFIQLNDTLH